MSAAEFRRFEAQAATTQRRRDYLVRQPKEGVRYVSEDGYPVRLDGRFDRIPHLRPGLSDGQIPHAGNPRKEEQRLEKLEILENLKKFCEVCALREYCGQEMWIPSGY